MPFCEDCGKWFSEKHRHTCPSVWEVQKIDDDDYWVERRGYDEEEAAEAYAEYYNGDGAMLDHGQIEVRVRKPGSTDCKVFEVSAEIAVSYHIVEVDN